MSILVSKTVGDVTFIHISEPYPVFSATTKYVAINPNGRMFVNVPNSSMWFPLDKKRYSEMQQWDSGSSSSYTSANNGVYSFYSSSLFSPTATTLNGFTRQATPGATALVLSANTDTVGRFLNSALIGMYVVTTAGYDQMPYEIMPTLNNSSLIPVIGAQTGRTWGAGTDCSPDVTSGQSTHIGYRIFDIDGNVGDFIKIAGRVYSDGATTYGTYGTKHYKLTTELLEEPTVLSYNNWEDGSLGGWVYANENQTNKWNIGTATSYNGSYSLYVTSGVTSFSSNNLYNVNDGSVSHIYRDFKLPLGNQASGTTPYYLSFFYRSVGNLSDGANIYLTPTNVIPSGGTVINPNYRLNLNQYSGATGYTATKVVFSGINIVNENVIAESWERADWEGWTVVNGAQTNKWNIGSGASFTGRYSAYVTSSTTGVTAANLYNVNSTSISHFYRDVVIPNSGDSVFLTFRWRCQGENGASTSNYDFGAVVIADTGTSVNAGAEVLTAKATSGGNGRIGGDATYGKFNLAYVAGGLWNTETINMTSYKGLTKRLIFTWVNDASLGTNPPMAIDNIFLYYTYNDNNISKDSDGYVNKRLIISWENSISGGTNPPMAIDNLSFYCYPSVPNDKV